MLWVFCLLLSFILKAESMNDECNYVNYWGMPYATDRCNSYVSRSSYYYWEESYIFRCGWDGNSVVLEWYDSWNCSGWPYYWDFNVSDNTFNCNGTESCYMSVTGYNLDQPCGTSYSDSYWYTVYSQDVCIEEDSWWYMDNSVSCSGNSANIDMFWGNDSCASEPYYSYSWTPECNESSYYPYNRYEVNCSAEYEPLPVPHYQEHYCDTNDCWTYPTPAPTVPYNFQVNRNDADSCAFVNWYGDAIAPNECYHTVYTWSNYSYGYSMMLQCNADNSGVDVTMWYGTTDCQDGYYSWNSTYGVSEFNCIGTKDCHVEYDVYATTDYNDPTCATASEEPTLHMVYATDICTDGYYGYPQKITCNDNGLQFSTYWNYNYSGCVGYESKYTVADGCVDRYNSSFYPYYTKYSISCKADSGQTTKAGQTTKIDGDGGNSKNEGQKASKRTTDAVISVTVVLVVLLIIAVAFVTYLTRKSRFSTKIDKTGMLADGNSKGDEIFNDDGRGIRNTTSNTNSGFDVGISDFHAPVTNTTTAGEYNQDFPKTMSLVGMQGDEDGDNVTR